VEWTGAEILGKKNKEVRNHRKKIAKKNNGGRVKGESMKTSVPITDGM